MTYGNKSGAPRCALCTHWNEYYRAIAPSLYGPDVEVCPCMAAIEGDEDAPFADAGGLPQGPVIMTEARHCCDAFAPYQDAWDAIDPEAWEALVEKDPSYAAFNVTYLRSHLQ